MLISKKLFLNSLRCFLFIGTSVALFDAYAADWKPIPNLPNYSYDAASANQHSESAAVWIRLGNDDRTMKYFLINCKQRQAGQIIGGSATVHDIQPGSWEESLMVLCKSKWQLWK